MGLSRRHNPDRYRSTQAGLSDSEHRAVVVFTTDTTGAVAAMGSCRFLLQRKSKELCTVKKQTGGHLFGQLTENFLSRCPVALSCRALNRYS
jgi:hypothetical protein